MRFAKVLESCKFEEYGCGTCNRETEMADDKKKRGASDRRQVAGGEPYEVKYAAKKAGVTPVAVKKAIKKVGNDRAKVMKEVKKTTTKKKR